MRDNAAELKDGTKVFQSTDNTSIYTEHGKRLSDEKAKNIRFSKNASKWESYKPEKGDNDALLRDKKKLTDYKTDVLDDINLRRKDTENPLTKEDLEDLQENFPKLPVLETKSINMPASYNIDTSSVASLIAPDSTKPTNSITPSFGKAHDGILDLAELNAVKPKNIVIPAP